MSKEAPQIRFSLRAMSVDSFAMNDLKMLNRELIRDDSDRVKLHYDFKGSYAAFSDLEVIQIQLAVNVSGWSKVNDDELLPVCHLKTAFDFHIENYTDFLNKDGDLKIPYSVTRTFASISYGTTRGILYTKTLGTTLGLFVMPMLDLGKFKKEDLVIKKDQIQTDKSATEEASKK